MFYNLEIDFVSKTFWADCAILSKYNSTSLCLT